MRPWAQMAKKEQHRWFSNDEMRAACGKHVHSQGFRDEYEMNAAQWYMYQLQYRPPQQSLMKCTIPYQMSFNLMI